MARTRTLIYVVTLIVTLALGTVADAACPSPSHTWCNATCGYNLGCNYSTNPCALCTLLEGGCGGWTSCSCCEFGALF